MILLSFFFKKKNDSTILELERKKTIPQKKKTAHMLIKF